MEIKKSNYKTKCDVGGCKNLCDYDILRENGSKKVFSLCTSCVNELYKSLGKIVIPDAIPSAFVSHKRINK